MPERIKRAVSVSIGSSKRNKSVEIPLLGQRILIERIGTDGDLEKAAQLYKELDGKVDAFGVGGTDLGFMIDEKWYPLHSIQSMVRFVKKTPMVDGGGLKNTLERGLAQFLEDNIGDYINAHGRTVLVTSGADRWGMAMSFEEGGYDCVFGDLMFGLGLPFALRSERSLKRIAALILPIASRLPFEWLYPTGEKQEKREPKWEHYYRWATVVAGDCHYVRGHMPDDMEGKVIVTNTTVEEDVALFKDLGVKYLITSTPVLDGRSFGTNMMEAALVALSGKKRPLTAKEINDLLIQLDLKPQLHQLN
jgi:hypothetical protein